MRCRCCGCRRAHFHNASASASCPALRRCGPALLAAPVARPPAALLASADNEQPAATLPPLHLRVLLVEDNTVNRMVAEQLLRVFQCEVRNAADGEQALAALREGGVDIVLMDCQMPVLDGYAAAPLAPEEVETGRARLPIIAMTANAMAGDRERCLQAGMDDYLSKPIARATLHALLLRWGGGKAASPGQLSVEPSVEPSHARLTASGTPTPSAEHGSALQETTSQAAETGDRPRRAG